MNLGKLLGAGRSFFGGRGVVSYRKDKRVYLPKFNGEKNPFVPEVEVKKTAVAPKTEKIPVFAPQKTLRATNWAEKLNPFRAPVPVAMPVQNAVQAELSLNAVKVLHNDLSDADVEVVPIKSRVAAPKLSAARGSLDFIGERQLEIA